MRTRLTSPGASAGETAAGEAAGRVPQNKKGRLQRRPLSHQRLFGLIEPCQGVSTEVKETSPDLRPHRRG